jgi:hypothetical protein
VFSQQQCAGADRVFDALAYVVFNQPGILTKFDVELDPDPMEQYGGIDGHALRRIIISENREGLDIDAIHALAAMQRARCAAELMRDGTPEEVVEVAAKVTELLIGGFVLAVAGGSGRAGADEKKVRLEIDRGAYKALRDRGLSQAGAGAKMKLSNTKTGKAPAPRTISSLERWYKQQKS